MGCKYTYYKSDDIRLYCKYTKEFCMYQTYCPKTKKNELSGREGRCILKKMDLDEYLAKH